jgi:Fe-S cluster biogenesis protein NfuA
MGTDDRDIISEVEAVLDEFVRPYLAAHGGDLKVVGVEGGVVFFNLMGRCVGCAAADQTSEELINRQLVERVPGIKKAVLANGISPELLEQTLALLRAHPSF